jgi:hypothetical protein
MDYHERNRRIGEGFDVGFARYERDKSRGHTEEEARSRRWQSVRSAAYCVDCLRPLAPTDSVTRCSYNFGSTRNPNWHLAARCLLCTLDPKDFAGSWYFTKPPDHPEYTQWTRLRCRNCGRLIRVGARRPPLTAQICCDDCRALAILKRNAERRRVVHEPQTCIHCGESFMPKRADAATCSNKCRQATHRAKAKGAGGYK